MTLNINDFQQKPVGELTYWSYENDHLGIEICLETCLNGFDVAIYNLQGDLLKPKLCSDCDASDWLKVIEVSLENANKLLNEHIWLKNQN
jgi:hypothetical protein